MSTVVVHCVITNKLKCNVQGNDNLHQVTTNKRYNLRIDLTDNEGLKCYAKYENFTVQSVDSKYLMTFDGFEGDCG